METDKKWYVIHTYSGYENKVMQTLERKVKSMGLENVINRILVPMEDEVDIKDGKKHVVKRKIFPGYVLVEMEVNDRSWYVVRNTRGVTGFVGPGSRPIPLSDAEVRMTGIENVSIDIDVEVGQNVTITSGPLENFVGTIQEINKERQKLKVSVSMFGRDTIVELDFVQVHKI